VVSGLGDFRRFKRVGPNAMRGRGIGTARGRATIMRGLFRLFLQIWSSTNVSIFAANGGVFPIIFRYVVTNYILQLVAVVVSRRRGQEVFGGDTKAIVCSTHQYLLFLCLYHFTGYQNSLHSASPNCTCLKVSFPCSSLVVTSVRVAHIRCDIELLS